MINPRSTIISDGECGLPAMIAPKIYGIKIVSLHRFGIVTCHIKYSWKGELSANTSQVIIRANTVITHENII
jgi:hypothetical protein